MIKKKILLVINEPLRKAGNQTVLMSTVRKLSNKYMFDILIFCNKEGYYDDEFKSFGGKIFRIPNYEGKNKVVKRIDFYFRWMWNRRKIRKILNYGYDVIQCNNGLESGYVLKEAKRYNIPIRIAFTVIINLKYNVLRNIYDYISLKLINKYATYKAGASKEACETAYHSKDYYVISNPYNDNYNMPIVLRTFDCPFLIQIGSYSSNKNQLFTIRVFNEILKEYPNAKLNFIGFEAEQRYLDKMEELVNELNIMDSITFNPSDTDAINLLDNSTHLLLTSIREAFGIVLLEGQARGVKCIASDCIPKDANVGGVEYLPLDSGTNSWADYIIKDFKKNKGAHINYDLSKFTEENIAKEYAKMYEGLL